MRVFTKKGSLKNSNHLNEVLRKVPSLYKLEHSHVANEEVSNLNLKRIMLQISIKAACHTTKKDSQINQIET